MWTEHIDSSPEEGEQQQQFSEEQMVRASLKFRAAKALLARKRPRHDSNHFPSLPYKSNKYHYTITTLYNSNFLFLFFFLTELHTYSIWEIRSHVKEEEESIIKRVPLSELSANTPIRAFPEKRLRNGYSQGTLFSPCSALSSNVDANVLIVSTDLDVNVHELDSFTTPSAKQSQFKLDHHTLPDILDDNDYFDDSILGEIDVLCQQQKQLSAQPSHFTSVESAHHPSARSSPQSIAYQNNSEEAALPGAYSKLMFNISRKMPAYAHYLDSLSERQQEAACSDISIPLMIVAGPGSGKVVSVFM